MFTDFMLLKKLKRKLALITIMGSSIILASPVLAQFGPPPPPPPITNAREAAPIDLTGNWVSIITESWRFRMVTPGVGDFQGVPITAEALAVAGNWDPDQDEAMGLACKSYGAAAIMRVPGRLKISWVDDNQLKVEIDAGRQTRLIYFGKDLEDAPDEPSWQGYSVGEWVNMSGGTTGPGLGIPGFSGDTDTPRSGTLKVTTTNMLPGYLRKNGLPYSENAVMTEYWNVREISGESWIVITTEITDPLYLDGSYYTSPNFRQEPDDSKWNPTECDARW
jgi:hypothetical protein